MRDYQNSELQIGRHYPAFAFEVLCFRVSAADWPG
jgi:hypothetical protein